MAIDVSQFEQMKSFLEFGADDAVNLKALGPVFAKHGGRITDDFYLTLEKYPTTAKLIEGRVAALKATHGRWMSELFGGSYDEAYFHNRMKVGMVHVKVGLDPYWVEGVMTHLRLAGLLAIREELSGDEAERRYASYVKVLDLDLAIINLAYAEERLDRLTRFTGMSRKLLENCIKKG